MPVPPAGAPTSQQAACGTDRLARQLGRKSVCWSVVLIWLLIIVRLNGFAATWRGTVSTVPGDLPASAASTGSSYRKCRAYPDQTQRQAVVVFARDGGLTAADMAAAVSARAAEPHLVGCVRVVWNRDPRRAVPALPRRGHQPVLRARPTRR